MKKPAVLKLRCIRDSNSVEVHHTGNIVDIIDIDESEKIISNFLKHLSKPRTGGLINRSQKLFWQRSIKKV